MRFLFVLLLTLCLTAFLSDLLAQESEQSEERVGGALSPRVGSYYSIIPIVGYSSDFGLYGGGLLQRIQYGDGVSPFLSNMKFDATISTRGNFITKLDYERTTFLGRDLRTRFDFIGQIDKQGHFFGVGNNTPFSRSLFDEKVYFYENRELFINHQLRKELFSFGRYGNADIYSNLVYWQVNPLTLSESSLLGEEQPFGFEKGRLAKTGIGFIADSRDSEFAPTEGGRYDLLFNIAPALPFLDYSYSEMKVDLRNYLSLFPTVVFAHRFQAEKIFGTAPFWAQPILGDEYNLRGYHRNRFRGSASLLSMTELRSWLFSLWQGEVRVGMQLFWDTGRVFSENDSGELFRDWKHTFGAGGAFTLFSPDFIIRGDVGISDETFRIYFGMGYTF